MSMRIDMAKKTPVELITISDEARMPCLSHRLLPDINNIDTFKVSKKSLKNKNLKICEIMPIKSEKKFNFEKSLRRP